MVTAGEVLKTKRESLGKTISQISQETKIQEKFLKYIEENQYQKFDSDIFVSGFIKIYSENLGLDTDRVLALYRRGNGHIYEKIEKNTIKVEKKKKKILSPKNIIIGTLVVFLIGIIGYIGYEIYLFQNPPVLEITEPENNTTTLEQTINIKGRAQNSTYVMISDKTITLGKDGTFSYQYALEIGENNINIITHKEGSNQETTETIVVIYEPEEEEIKEEEEEKEYLLKLVIEDADTWIKLDIDGVNKISRTVEPSEFEYIVEEEFEIISGRPSNTTVYVNDEEYELQQDPSSGTYTLSCTVLQSGLVCE